ncbi:MAG: histidine phosphatase family protein [Clostridia bacterium]|nr:histidine phosphatase family protein [Clostridia bacterium]
MSVKTIYLIRHAHPDYPGGVKMCLGQKNDLPLSSRGFEQAQALGRRFACIPLEAVYASPLLRARQTAQAIAGDQRPLRILDDLIELDGGEWDGLTYDQLHERFPAHFGPGAKGGCPPGGESDEAGLARMLSALSHVESQTVSCAAVVAHSGVNRLALCRILGLPLSEKKKTGQDYAAVAVLTCTEGVWAVQEYAARHL